MTYFAHYDLTPELGLRESIDKVLASNVTTGNGMEYHSNYDEVTSWNLKSLVPVSSAWSMASYSRNADTFKLAPRVTSADMKELVDMVECLTEYAVLNERRYNDMVHEETERQLAEIANDYGVDPEVFVDLANEMDIYGESGVEGIYVPITDEQVAELVEQTKRDSQTDHAHYYGGQWHSPEHCARCQEFPQLIGARA